MMAGRGRASWPVHQTRLQVQWGGGAGKVTTERFKCSTSGSPLNISFSGSQMSQGHGVTSPHNKLEISGCVPPGRGAGRGTVSGGTGLTTTLLGQVLPFFH